MVPARAQTISAEIPSPESFLGYKPGDDQRLLDSATILAYFQALDRTSPRLVVQTLGKSTLGRPFWMAVISAPENLQNLNNWIKIQGQLADPRALVDAQARRIMKDAKVIVSINCSIHPREVGPSQMSLELAYKLANDNSAETLAILQNVILLLIPTHNPDGLDLICEWYKKFQNTPFAGGPYPFLDHYYCGHDINRDWILQSQKETRITVDKVYNVWHPHIAFDLHQMGYFGARMFLPPYADPWDENVSPILQAQATALGAAIAAEMTAKGFPGIVHQSGFDAYAPSRAYLFYHGGVRFLGEIASAMLATPIRLKPEELQRGASFSVTERAALLPMPWKGGVWRLGDIVDYGFHASWALLKQAALNRADWISRSHAVLKESATERDNAMVFIIPPRQADAYTLHELLKILQAGQVEIHQARDKVAVSGTLYPEGSFLIPVTQPYGSYAKTILEKRTYRGVLAGDEDAPYDVSTYNMAVSLGVKVLQGEGEIYGNYEKMGPVKPLQGSVSETPEGEGYFLDYRNLGAVKVINRLLAAKIPVYWLKESLRTMTAAWPAGTVWVKSDSTRLLKDLAHIYHVQFVAGRFRTPQVGLQLSAPRIGLYNSFLADSDEGWTRYVLESFDFKYERLLNNAIQRGDLRNQFDVIILPSQSAERLLEGAKPKEMPDMFCGGIGKEGMVALAHFIEDGGTLIALNQACILPVAYWGLPVRNVTADIPRTQLYIPGAFLRSTLAPNTPLGYGVPADLALFVDNSPAFVVESGEAALIYPAEGLLVDGYARGEAALTGRAALAQVNKGMGRILLYGFRPQFRGQTQNTFKLLFNGLYLGAAKEAVCP